MNIQFLHCDNPLSSDIFAAILCKSMH